MRFLQLSIRWWCWGAAKGRAEAYLASYWSRSFSRLSEHDEELDYVEPRMEELLLPENLTFSIEIVLGTINMTFLIYDGSRVRSGRSRDRLH